MSLVLCVPSDSSGEGTRRSSCPHVCSRESDQTHHSILGLSTGKQQIMMLTFTLYILYLHWHFTSYSNQNLFFIIRNPYKLIAITVNM